MDTTLASEARPVDPFRAAIILFGRYRLEWRLGRGATSEVWCARDLMADRRVTLKVLHPDLCDSPPALARFESEARMADGLPAEQVLRVLGTESSADMRALVFPYVPGEALDGVLARGRLPAHEAASVARDVAAALASAHAAGIVHRDVKPGNILVEPDGHTRLLDFGIAKALEPADGVATSAGIVMGTVRYMPPERLAGGPAGPATDIYQLGAVLYEMLAGAPAFDPARGLSRTPPEPLADVPVALMRICLTMLAEAPSARLHDAAAVSEALDAWLSGRAVTPAPVPAPGASSDATTVLDGASLGVSRTRTRAAAGRHARRSWWAAAAGVAIAVGCVLATLPAASPSEQLEGEGLVADAAAPTIDIRPVEPEKSTAPRTRVAVARPPTSRTTSRVPNPGRSDLRRQAKGDRGRGHQEMDKRGAKPKDRDHGKGKGKGNDGRGHRRH